MRAMTDRLAAGSAHQPPGRAFTIDDLLRMRAWADRQGVRMVVHLDHCVGDEACEEAVAFHANAQPACFLLIWRGAGTIVVQASPGQALAYQSVSHVLEALVASQDPATTDTTAR